MKYSNELNIKQITTNYINNCQSSVLLLKFFFFLISFPSNLTSFKRGDKDTEYYLF